MKATQQPQKAGGISEAAVRAGTGKGWQEWFAILDAADAKDMNHKEIVACLSRKYGRLGGWWLQMVTVGYEQARGLREKHQTPRGYEISVSRSIAGPVGSLFKSWQDENIRTRWLAETPIVIHKATPNKSMRITWARWQNQRRCQLLLEGKRQVSGGGPALEVAGCQGSRANEISLGEEP